MQQDLMAHFQRLHTFCYQECEADGTDREHILTHLTQRVETSTQFTFESSFTTTPATRKMYK